MAEPTAILRDFLVRTPFFGGLAEGGLDRVIAMLRERTFAPGELVFREGESGRSMYIIASGDVVVTRDGDRGAQVRLFHFRTGDFFGETTLIEMHPRPYTARVEVQTELFELTAADLYKLYRDDLHAYVLVLQNINRELCRRLRSADGRITEIADEFGDERTQMSGPRSTPGLPPLRRG